MFLDEQDKEQILADLEDLSYEENLNRKKLQSPTNLKETSYIFERPAKENTLRVTPVIPDSFDAGRKDAKEKTKKGLSGSSILRIFMEYVILIVVAVVLALFINHFVIFNANVPTGSMNNTIMEGDRLIGLRLSYVFGDPKCGEIMIFRYPDNPEELFIKRVIGTPGDLVEIKTTYNILGTKETNVYVNGKKLYEPYLREPMEPVNSGEDLQYLVPADCYFVMGDNRNNSLDSRYWTHTYVPRENVIARAIFKYYPSLKFINTRYQ